MRKRIAGAVVVAMVVGLAAADEPESGAQPVNQFMDEASPPARTPTEHAPAFANVDLREVAKIIGQVTRHEIVLAPEVCGLFTATWEDSVSSEQLFEDFMGHSACDWIFVSRDRRHESILPPRHARVLEIPVGHHPRESAQG